jgi:hypothetical protein
MHLLKSGVFIGLQAIGAMEGLPILALMASYELEAARNLESLFIHCKYCVLVRMLL